MTGEINFPFHFEVAICTPWCVTHTAAKRQRLDSPAAGCCMQMKVYVCNLRILKQQPHILKVWDGAGRRTRQQMSRLIISHPPPRARSLSRMCVCTLLVLSPAASAAAALKIKRLILQRRKASSVRTVDLQFASRPEKKKKRDACLRALPYISRMTVQARTFIYMRLHHLSSSI